MKLAIFLAFITASVNSIAQEAPRPAAPPSSFPTPSAPAAAPPLQNAPQSNYNELIDLMRAQTTAIKSLSIKLESLEKRVSQIERQP